MDGDSILRRAAALAALALVLALAGCGGDDDEGEDGNGEEAAPAKIKVTADEYSFEVSETPTAGQTTFTLRNKGEEGHVLLLARLNEGFTLREAFELEGRQGSANTLGTIDAGPGEKAKQIISADLTPGDYAMICPIGPPGETHFDRGQRYEFTIE